MSQAKGRSVPVAVINVFHEETGKKILINKTQLSKYRAKGYFRKSEKPVVESAEQESDEDTVPVVIDLEALDEAGLAELVKSEDLPLDLNDYDTVHEKREAVAEAMDDQETED